MIKKFYDLGHLNKPYKKNFIKNTKKIFDDGFYISGDFVLKFEKNFSKFNKSKYSIAVGNGYDAIRLSLELFKHIKVCKQNDEVIVPSNSYIATILPVNAAGLKPVFVEPEKKGLNLDPIELKKKINKKTKVVIVTHLYGHVAQMDEILKITKKYNIKVIEDCSQAHGASYKNKYSGNFGDIGCFSLFPSKNLGAIGDAGIITTNNKNYEIILRSLRNYGEENFTNYGDRKYKNILKGFNSRMSELDAVLLNLKLKDLKKNNLDKSRKANFYLKNIKNKLIELPIIKKNSRPVWHQFLILAKDRNKLKKYLKHNGYETKIVYPIPPHRQIAYKEMKDKNYPITDYIHNKNLCLPIESHFNYGDLKKIVKLINKFDFK